MVSPSADRCCSNSFPVEPGVHDRGGGTLEEGVISLEGERRREAHIFVLYWILSGALPTPPFPTLMVQTVLEEEPTGCFSPHKTSPWGGLRSATVTSGEDVPSRCPHHMYVSIPAHPTSIHGLSYIIPLGLGLLLLKPAIFPAVKQLHQEPPDQQEHQANEGHTSNCASHDQCNVGRFRALCRTDRQHPAAAPGETTTGEPAACPQWGRRSRAGVPLLESTMTVYISSPSSWTMRKEIQQLLESFSLHCLLSSVDSSAVRMLGQAWVQFFAKGPLSKALHSTQELQNSWPQLTSAGAEVLSPGFGRLAGGGDPRRPPCHLCMSLTRICHRERGSWGTPGRRGAGTAPGTGSGCSGRSHGGCTRSCGCSSSSPWTSCTGRHCPGTRACTRTPRSCTSRGL